MALAEAIGWSHIENANSLVVGGAWRGYPPVGAIVGKKDPIPRFNEDLNACRDARSKLSEEQRKFYLIELEMIVRIRVGFGMWKDLSPEQRFYEIHNASADNQCEALVKAFGKWTGPRPGDPMASLEAMEARRVANTPPAVAKAA